MSLFHYLFDKLYPLIRFNYERLQKHNWIDKVGPQLWLGGAPTYQRDYEFVLANQIGAVIDIRNEREDDLALYAKHDIRHIKLRVPDIAAPPPEIIEQGVAFIQQNIADGREVYVHCAKGRGRSATLTAGYLMKHEGLSFEQARDQLKAARPLVKLEARHKQVLEAWLSGSTS